MVLSKQILPSPIYLAHGFFVLFFCQGWKTSGNMVWGKKHWICYRAGLDSILMLSFGSFGTKASHLTSLVQFLPIKWEDMIRNKKAGGQDRIVIQVWAEGLSFWVRRPGCTKEPPVFKSFIWKAERKIRTNFLSTDSFPKCPL